MAAASMSTSQHGSHCAIKEEFLFTSHQNTNNGKEASGHPFYIYISMGEAEGLSKTR